MKNRFLGSASRSIWAATLGAALIAVATIGCGSDDGGGSSDTGGGADSTADTLEDGGAGDASDGSGSDAGADGTELDGGPDGVTDAGDDVGSDGSADAGGDGEGPDADGDVTEPDGDNDTVNPTTNVRLNEVMYTSLDGSADFIELYNAGDSEADVSGWLFRDDNEQHAFTFPPGTTIAAKGFLVAYRDGGPGTLLFDFGLGEEDAARIFSLNGGLVDEIEWTAGAAPPGRTLGRYPDGSGAFTMLSAPTPGAANAEPYTETQDWPQLVVNEVVAQDAAGGPDWAEIYNPTSEPVSLQGWRATDKPSDPPLEWTELGALTVPAKGYLVLTGPNDLGVGDFDFGLGAGDDFLLAAPDYQVIDFADWKPGRAPMGLSYGRLPAGSGAGDEGEWATLDTPTPGTANVAPAELGDGPVQNGLTITEIMAGPVMVEDALGEWFEVVNTLDTSLNIDGWIVADGGGGWHRIDSGGPWVLAPGAVAVIGRSTDTSVNGGVDVDYSIGDAFALSNAADSVVFLAWGRAVERVDYDVDAGWPVAAGASMQLDPSATKPIPNDFASNWCLSKSAYGDGDLGTPGEENDACTPQ